MKTTKEIVGLPLISISDGIEVGYVKDIIVNADKGAIEYLIIDSGIQALSTKVIQVSDILGIGENAVTIENSQVMFDTSKIPAAIDLLQKNVQVKGTKIFTKKGKLIGQVVEFSVDDDNNCVIRSLEYITSPTDTKHKVLNYDIVITYGKSIVVVQDSMGAVQTDSTSNIQRVATQEVPNEEATKTETSAALLFEERQKQYLKGKILTKTILDMDGNTIFPEGTQIDDEVIEIAKQKGKFIEITMNNKAG